ncbi:hypothetical protein ALC60_04685 [Trachymyrmex zeteki]|uniref:Gustatory receptor n=1 Tax=Mycetomoellerius zeteki TaxID=64791 RepID=A0A151X7Q6_9HYME|nr:hypothetical protein ALC60_04685 [Trachymyrmex zeteki]
MTETLERALAPLMTIGSFCDLGMFEHPVGQPRPYLSCLYVLAKWSFLTYTFYYPMYIYSFKSNFIHLRCFEPLITITLVLISFCRFKVKILKWHVHLQLCLISRKLNIVFQVQMLMQIIWYLAEATDFCLLMYQVFGGHEIIWTFIESFTILYKCFTFVLYSILFLTLNYVCQIINETVAILYKLSNYNHDENVREQMYSTILSFSIILAQVYNILSILAVMHEKFCLIMVWYEQDACARELKMCLRELAIVDNTLEVLGMPKKYQRLHNWIIRMIIGWILYIFTNLAYINLVFTIFFPNNTLNSLYLTYNTFIYFYPAFVITMNVLISATILGLVHVYTFTFLFIQFRYTRSRFHRVNDLLHILDSNLCESSADSRRQNRSILVHQRITGSKGHNQYIWIIMHVHLQLCLISRKLNIVFKVQMLMQMIWYLAEALQFYLIMYQVFGGHQIIWTFLEFIRILYKCFIFVLYSILFLTLNSVCQTVYYKINETVAILYKLSNYNLDDNLREQVNNYNKILYRILTVLWLIVLVLKIRTPT